METDGTTPRTGRPPAASGGTVALVTGGTSGLGLAAARRLAAAGHRLVLTGRDPDRAAKAIADLGEDVASYVPGDVTDERAVGAAVAAATSLGRLSVAVNCAGTARSGRVLGRRGPLPLADFAAVVAANLTGTFNVVRLAAEAMARNDLADGHADRGVIVCTSSIAGYDGQQGQAAYAASKAGVNGMTLPLARDLARHAIRVVTVAPGLFATPMVAQVPEEALRAAAAVTPHPSRLGDPDDFGALVAHIAENGMMNGEVVRLDGGVRLPYMV
jgi:NAD(P)-dependent dehydrogenase (short-subunit alcohol dehydrogenase family)